MTVSVAEQDGRHRALVPGDGAVLRCCESGHETAGEAARHAQRLARAMARHPARPDAELEYPGDPEKRP